MITEPFNMIERKGLEVITFRDFSRLLMATNRDQVVKFEHDDRRYLVLKLADSHKQDLDYFRPLKKAIQSGQMAPKLLHYLQHVSLKGFLPMQVPKTEALMEEKIRCLQEESLYVYQLLQDGSFQLNGGWPARITQYDLKTHLHEWLMNQRQIMEGDPMKRLGKVLKKIGVTKKRARDASNGLLYLYELPPLEKARQAFANDVMMGEIEWDDD